MAPSATALLPPAAHLPVRCGYEAHGMGWIETNSPRDNASANGTRRHPAAGSWRDGCDRHGGERADSVEGKARGDGGALTFGVAEKGRGAVCGLRDAAGHSIAGRAGTVEPHEGRGGPSVDFACFGPHGELLFRGYLEARTAGR